jgi:hypothetical protein
MKEEEVTKKIAEIAALDPAFCSKLLRVLLRAATYGPQKASAQAHVLLRCVPRRHIQLVNERAFAHEPTLREAVRELLGGRQMPDWSEFDWLFLGTSIAVAVEVKTNRRTPFQPRQLERYHRALRLHPELQRRHRGVLALTVVRPHRDDLLRARRRPYNLGYVLWDQIGDELRSIHPANSDDEHAWALVCHSVLGAAHGSDHAETILTSATNVTAGEATLGLTAGQPV